METSCLASAAVSATSSSATLEPSTEECLRLAARGRASAWDAEFVFVAGALGLPLVTADRRLARAFPKEVVTVADVVAGL